VQEGTKKTIIFCNSRDHVGEVQNFFPDAKPYHWGVSRKERQATYNAFRRGKLREILVVNMFNECMDIPEAELLIFWRATDSKRIWLQQLGRGLRDSAKTVIVLDYVANCDRIMAVKELGLEVTKYGTGKPEYLERLKLNIGLSIEFTEELVEIVTLLERLEAEFYPTWEEASAAAQKFTPRPTTMDEYRKVYKKDPRLPSNPDNIYPEVWKQQGGWPGFLGTLWYPTWEEASAAAQKLTPRPTTVGEYLKVYMQDPKLPSDPKRTYTSVWKQNGGLPGFLGIKKDRK
jgi:superfamily II DNA/RNA helicase